MKERFLTNISAYFFATGSAMGLYTAMLSLERITTTAYIVSQVPPERQKGAQMRASQKYEKDLTRVPLLAIAWPVTIACSGARFVDWAAGGEIVIFQDSFIELGTVRRELERERGMIRS
jgi:hypothetical protein